MRRAGSGLSAGGVQHPGCTLAQRRSPVPPRQPPPRTVPGSPGWTLEPPAAGVDSPAPGHGPFICPNKPPAAAGGAHEAVTPQSGGARGCPPSGTVTPAWVPNSPTCPPSTPAQAQAPQPALPPTPGAVGVLTPQLLKAFVRAVTSIFHFAAPITKSRCSAVGTRGATKPTPPATSSSEQGGLTPVLWLLLLPGV